MPSHVKHTNGFLNKMKDINKVPEETYLVTMDLKSLYTNIPNSEGIAATNRALDKGKTKTAVTSHYNIFSTYTNPMQSYFQL